MRILNESGVAVAHVSDNAGKRSGAQRPKSRAATAKPGTLAEHLQCRF